MLSMITRITIAGALFMLAAASSAFAQAVCPANSFGAASAPITALPYTVGPTDFCLLKVFNSAAPGAVNIPSPGTAGNFFPNFNTQLMNEGTGTLTLTPLINAAGATPTINGTATITLTTGQNATLSIGTDGNWYANTNSGSTGGVAPVANGGTGRATLTAHDILLGEGTSPVGLVAPSATSGVPVISQGGAADPIYGTAVVAGGGTGATTLTAHGVLLGEGTASVTPLAAATAGQILYGVTSADPAWGTPASVSAKPGNPSATGSLTGVMMGLSAGPVITPTTTGRIILIITGDTINNTANDGTLVQAVYGTGTAPVNGATATGTNVGNPVRFINAASTTEKVPFTVQSIVTSLALNTGLWLDINLAAITGGSATIGDVTISAHEF